MILMARRQALVIDANGERFRFYYDLEHPEALHITVRHNTTPEDAIRMFFTGDAPLEDAVHSRMVTLTQTHGLYWTRHAHDQSVIVISCFGRGDE